MKTDIIHKDIPLMTSTSLSPSWTIKDYLGAFSVRLGIRRNKYKVTPGLFHMGSPDTESPVFVTANYKLSLDHLRRGLKNRDCWILVLDTRGVNVWCAAGKGTFGTEELIRRVKAVDLESVVSHRSLILPQLGAPGMNPVEVKKGCSFTIKYGPVEADDINAFMEGGEKATPAMRRKNFPLTERLAVSLTHTAQGILPALALSLLFILADWRLTESINITGALVISITALVTGSLLAGALLPVLPGRAFSVKGFFIGLLIYPVVFLSGKNLQISTDALYPLGKALLLHCFIVYQVLNLTGSSTYTSLSGVRKEMSIAIPLLIITVITGAVSLIAGGILA